VKRARNLPRPVFTRDQYQDAAVRVLSRAVAFGECAIDTGTPSRDYPMVAVGRHGDSTYPMGSALVVARAAGWTIGPDDQVDHVCFTRRCVAFDHLRVIPGAVNRGRRRNVRQTAPAWQVTA
jgi:hypothetical protein